MRIHRYRSGSPGRTPRRRPGCLPWVIVMGVIFGFLITTWVRLGTWLNVIESEQASGDLRTAQRAFDRGDLDTAVEQARQVWAAEPDNRAALELLVRSLIYRSYSDYDRELDRTAALQYATAAMNSHPLDPHFRAIQALALQANGRPVQAAALAEGVLREFPDHTLARVALGLAYGAVGGYENALNENRRAATEAGTSYRLDAQRALGVSLSDLGQYREAIRAVDLAIAENNKLALLHFERALYALQMGDAGAATSSYFRVLAFDPDNVKARLRMCELSSMLREGATALDYCRRVTQTAPGWVLGWYNLGREYFLQGDFASAQQALNRCTRLSIAQDIPIVDRKLDCWYLQGQAAEILGDCDNLIRVYGEFREMVAVAQLPQTWTYPPEGPAICLRE